MFGKFSLLPREIAFFELFRNAAHNVVDGSRLLMQMMQDFRDPAGMAQRIKDVEHAGDTLTHELVVKLNQTFITPIDREDIYGLACALDDILDMIDAVADRFVVFKVRHPSSMAIKMSGILHEATVAVAGGIDMLGKGHADIQECCIKVNSLENDADRVLRDALSDLFEREKDPIEVIKWKEIYETFEEGSDRCEDVSNILESIALKHV